MFLDRLDLFLKRIAGIKLENLNDIFLADPVGAVGGLILDSWIPPGIVVDDGVRASQVQASAACPQ